MSRANSYTILGSGFRVQGSGQEPRTQNPQPRTACCVGTFSHSKRTGEAGLTLAEVLVASVITGVILVALVQAYTSQTRLEGQLLVRNSNGGLDFLPALAVSQLSTDLKQADRVVIPSSSTIKIRRPSFTTAGCTGPAIPAPSCFDSPANYRWVEYKLVGSSLAFYDNIAAGCPPPSVITPQVTATFSYADPVLPNAAATSAPPGGEPFAPSTKDNNVVDYDITWTQTGPVQDPISLPNGRRFHAKVAIRAGAYSNVNANAATNDSGSGLAPSISAPFGAPPTC